VGVRRLTDVGRRGKGEIGVAAELPEKVELVVDAAVAAVGPSVGQGPVAVDERPPRSTSRSGQERVTVEVVQGELELASKRLPRVAVVVQVNLHLAEAQLAELGERFDEVGMVLLARKEEGVPRWLSVVVAEFGRELGIFL